jgi:MFS family permease
LLIPPALARGEAVTDTEVPGDESGFGWTSEVAGRASRLVLYDALSHEAMGALTTGVFLAGFAVALDASNFAIGVLAAIPFLAQLLQIPAVVLIERLRSRRSVSVWASGLGRIFLLASAAAPLLGHEAGVLLLIAALAVHQGTAAISGCAWNSWMRDLVPPTEYGRFFGRRTAATTAVSIAMAFIGGFAIDAWKSHVPGDPALGYSGLFALSALIGLFGVYLLHITPERPMPRVREPAHFVQLLSRPFLDGNFRRLILFLSSWNFAVNLAAPFFTVYMLKTLGYDMTVIIALTIVSQLSNLAALGIWGTLIDRFSNKAVLGVSAPLFLACILAWTFTGVSWAQPIMLYLLGAIHVLMGIATAGVALASGNIAMKLSPEGEATSYLAANSVVTSAFAAAAPIIGGFGADFFASHQLTLAFTWTGGEQDVTVQVLKFQAWTFLFGVACVLGLYSMHRLSFVEETGRTSDHVVFRHLLLEVRRSAQSLSSAAGLTRIVRLPMELLRGEHGGRS